MNRAVVMKGGANHVAPEVAARVDESDPSIKFRRNRREQSLAPSAPFHGGGYGVGGLWIRCD